MSTQLAYFNMVKLEPYQDPRSARTIAGQMTVSTQYARGQLLGQIASTGKWGKYAPGNTSQLIKIQGPGSGGTFAISARKSDGTWVTTAPIAYNAIASAIATALNAVLGTSAVAVTMAVDIATGATLVFSGTGYAGVPQPNVTIDASLTTGATSTSVVNNTTLTGIETARAICVYDFVTDSSGNVIYTGTAATPAGLITPPNDTAELYVAGKFLVSDLTGLDAAAVTALNASYLGVGAYQVLEIP